MDVDNLKHLLLKARKDEVNIGGDVSGLYNQVRKLNG